MFSTKISWQLIGASMAEVCKDLPLNKPMAKNIRGKAIMMVNLDGQAYAMQDKCPHQGKRLSDGWCEDGRIVCPFHRYSFDLKTGEGMGTRIDIYKIEEREDGIYIGIPYFSFF